MPTWANAIAMADVLGTVVGVVGFGLQLATTLQTYMELTFEAEDALRDIVFEVNATASALKQLQTIVDADKALPDAQSASRVFKDGGLREVEALDIKCETVYKVVVRLIQKASSSDDDAGQATASSKHAALDPWSLKPMNVFRKLRWPWLVPRINRCQGQLRWLKISLLVTLQLANLAQQQLRYVAHAKANEEPLDVLTRRPQRNRDGGVFRG